MSPPLPRNHGIDRLRGLSIVLVVAHHTGIRIALKRTALGALVPGRVLAALTGNGYEAVFVFFVISGFLITTNALSRWGNLGAIDARAFYARRAARILPCLLALVLVLASLHLAGAHDYLITHASQSLGGAIASALGLCLNWYEGRTGYLPGGWDVLWSLSIEEVFYLGFPLVCLATRGRAWLLVPALVLLALSLPVTRAALEVNEIWQEKAYLPGMAAIATGVLGALLTKRVPSPPRPFRVALHTLGLAGLAAVLFAEDVLWPVLHNGTMLVLTGSALCLVVAAYWSGDATSSRPFAGAGTGWLRSFGRLSYEIYLTHMFVVMALVSAFKRTGGDLRLAFLWYVPALGLSWALGAFVARSFSTPCDRALRRAWRVSI